LPPNAPFIITPLFLNGVLMSDLFFNELKKALNPLFDEQLERFKVLLHQQDGQSAIKTPVWFNLKQLCQYLPDKPAAATVYAKVHAGKIPVYKGNGKKLRFLKCEIDEWLMAGKNKTIAEINTESENYLKTKGGNR